MSNFFTWDSLGKTANIIQLISIVPWLLTAYLFFTRAKKYKKLIQERDGVTTSKPVALAIGLIGTGDISGQVAQFLKDKGLKMPVRAFNRKLGDEITRENIHSLLHGLLKIKSELTSKGITEVHLFIAAPVAFGAAVGALFDNWVPVKIYHHNHGKYEFWTELQKGRVSGIEEPILKDLLDPEL